MKFNKKILIIFITLVILIAIIYLLQHFNIIEKYAENDDLTIIITASVIPSHPDITMIKETMKSLDLINHKNSKIILAHDYSDKKEYKAYLKNLENYVKNMDNVQIVVKDDWGNLTGNVRNAMKYVNTKYVLLVQHDFPFIQKTDIHKVIEDMKSMPKLKYIRFNKRNNIKKDCDYDNKNFFNKYNLEGNNNYVSTLCWSDNNHLTTKKYYEEVVLKICKDQTFMEQILNKINNIETHDKFGTYIYGNLNEKPYIKHLNGKIFK